MQRNSNTYANSYCYCNRDSYTSDDSDSHIHAYAYSNGNTDTNSYVDCNAYTNSNSNSDCNSSTNRDSNTYAYSDADAVHWEMFTHAEAAPDTGTSPIEETRLAPNVKWLGTREKTSRVSQLLAERFAWPTTTI